MSIRQQKVGKVNLIAINGRLDQEQTPHLETTLNHLLANEHYLLFVDLSQTSYINSGGLRCLVSAWRKAKAQNGNLVLAGLNARLQEIFSMVGFDKVFQIYTDSDTAIKALIDS